MALQSEMEAQKEADRIQREAGKREKLEEQKRQEKEKLGKGKKKRKGRI